MPRQPAVIGQQQQPFGIHVQTADRQHPGQACWQMVKNGLTVLFVPRADDQPTWLVVTPQHRRLARRQRLFINGDDVGRCDIECRAGNHLTIHCHATLGNARLGVATRTYTCTGNMFGDALRPVGRAKCKGWLLCHGAGVTRKCGGMQFITLPAGPGCATRGGMDRPAKGPDIMARLLEEAATAAAAGEVPVAAAVTDDKGSIIAMAQNRMRRDANSLHHAEMLALRAAMVARGDDRLDGCDLWVTLEPCTMCAGAISHARIRRLYFGAADAKAGAVESGVRFFDSPACHHRPEVYGGLSATAASDQLKAFFAARR